MITKRLPRGVSGSILLLALLVVLAATLLLAGWAHVLATQVLNARASEPAIKRRIGMLNARAMAAQYALTRLPFGTVSTNVASLADPFGSPYGWGRMEWTTEIATNVFVSSPTFQWINHFSFGGFGGFAASNRVWVSALEHTNQLDVFLRTRSPQAAFYPGTFTINGSISVNRMSATNPVLVWTNLTGNFTRYQAPRAFSVGGGRIVGFPMVPVTAGNSSLSGTNFYDGRMEAPYPPLLSARQIYNDSVNPAITNDGIVIIPALTNTNNPANTVRVYEIRLADFPTTNPPVIVHHKIVATAQTNVKNIDLHIYGAVNPAAANQSPVIVSYGPFDTGDPAPQIHLRNVRFYNSTNSRPFLLHIRNNNSLTNRFEIRDAAGSSWRLAMNLWNSQGRFNIGGNMTILGGIWANRRVELSSGNNIYLRTDFLPLTMEYGLPRIGWIEIWEAAE